MCMYSLGGYVLSIALAAHGLCVCIASAAMWCPYSLGGYWVVAYDRPRRLWHGIVQWQQRILQFTVFLLTAGVFTSGAWALLSNLEDPELRRLAQALPATVLRSRADSTTKKYLGAYKRWKTWAYARQGVPSFPVQELHLVLHMQHLSESTESKAAVEEAVHALSWLHGVAGLQPLGGSPLVKATLEGLRRILAKPKVRKEPVTADMLKVMVEAAGPAPSLTEVRLLAVCLVAFAGFMRCDELIKLKCEDITFNTESMVIRIVSSETDQYREGSSLVIARTGELTCPVRMMEKYFHMGELEKTPKGCVFRGITVTKEGERLRKAGGLSYYTRLRELLLSKISQLGFDPKLFGLHSLRAGGGGGPQRQQMQVYLTDCSNDMVAGNLSQPRMATLKILWRND